jgi:hypothetical protein
MQGKIISSLKSGGAYSIIPPPSGRGSARIERTVRVREVGGSNPPAPTINLTVVYLKYREVYWGTTLGFAEQVSRSAR